LSIFGCFYLVALESCVYCDQTVINRWKCPISHFKMSLQSQLDNLIHEFCKRKISHPKLLEKILTDDARICPRLLELLMSKLDMKIILDELVSQALIWMDDEYKQGDVYILQKLSLVLENNQELLLMYDNLVRTLVQDQPRPDLRIPPIIVNDLKIALVPLGWICTRKFLDHLGKSALS